MGFLKNLGSRLGLEVSEFHDPGSRRWIIWSKEPFDSLGVEILLNQSEGFWLAGSCFFGGESQDLSCSFHIHKLYGHLGIRNLFSKNFRERSRLWAEKISKKIEGLSSYDLDPFEGREILGFSIGDRAISLNIWKNDLGWNINDHRRLPWLGNGWSFCLILDRIFFVKEVNNNRFLGNFFVELPEGKYPANLFLTSWRTIWPINLIGINIPTSLYKYTADLEFSSGIPVPGKGTHSWNVGDDFIYNLSFVFPEPPSKKEILKKTIKHIVDYRLKYSSLRWIPENGWPEHLIQD